MIPRACRTVPAPRGKCRKAGEDVSEGGKDAGKIC